MKKAIFILMVGAFAVAGFSSCKKCTTCEWKLNNNTVVTYPQQCGSKQDLDDWKATVNSTYTGLGYEFVCTDE